MNSIPVLSPTVAALQQSVDTALTTLAPNILTALERLPHAIPQPHLRLLLAQEDTHGALDLLRDTIEITLLAALSVFLLPALRQMVYIAMQGLATRLWPGVAVMPLAPPLTSPREALLTSRLDALVASTEDALPGILTRAMYSGQPVAMQVQDILADVGLTDMRAQQLTRYRTSLREAGEVPMHVQRLVARRSLQMRWQRAQAISETELMTAANAGRAAVLDNAIAGDMLDAGTIRRYWRTMGDARTCVVCLAIAEHNHEGVAWEEPFWSPQGPVMDPPQHIACRCVLEYILR